MPLENNRIALVDVKVTEVASTPAYFALTTKGDVRQVKPVPVKVIEFEDCDNEEDDT